LSKLPLIEGVLKYVEENNLSLCMPGHKGTLGFLSTPEGRRLYEKFINCDITEVDGVDNYHHPEGIIKDSQELLSKFYESKKSYYLVNGSTSGNLAMIFSSFNEGDEVIVERNCHRSIFNGIIMRKLKPIYIKNKINKEYNAPLSIDMEHFLCLLRENKNAKGIILTYPNYYGVCADLELIVKKAKEYGMKVLVDSAHGAHFGMHSKLPESAVKLGADMVVMSSHKTLPSLTQTAYLHVGEEVDIGKVDFYVSAFTTTSPSYMLMCSMEYARFYLEEYGKTDYEALIRRSEEYKGKIEAETIVRILPSEPTRYVLNLPKGYSGSKLFNYLKLKGITAEMCDNSNVVLIFSPFNDENNFKKLYKTLMECDFQGLMEEYKEVLTINIPESKMMPFQVMEKQKSKVSLKEAEGKVSAVNIVPYPPGIPVIMMGEIIDKYCINMIEYYLSNDIAVLGIQRSNDDSSDNVYVDVIEDFN